MALPPQDGDDRLDEFGLMLAPGGVVVMSDITRAETASAHHARLPVALVGFAAVSPAFARGRFPETRLMDVVIKRPAMDEPDAALLAALCGGHAAPPFWSRPEPFNRHLIAVIERHGLEALFDTDARPIQGITVRPRAVDWRQDAVIEAEMAAWRAAYRALAPARQIMAATILWLYRGDADETWLVDVPCAWHAADAVAALRNGGALVEWGRLVALYPGW